MSLFAINNKSLGNNNDIHTRKRRLIPSSRSIQADDDDHLIWTAVQPVFNI